MDQFWSIVRITANCLCPLSLVFAMCEFKCPRRRALAVIFSVGAVCSVLNSMLFVLAGREVMMRFYAVIMFVPVLIALLILTGDRFSMLFFDFFTAINLLYFVSIIGHIVAPEKIWLDTLVRIALYSLAVWLCSRYFSGPWHFLSKHMKRGWGVICVIPFLFFALVMFLGLYPKMRHDNFAAVIFLYFILALVYLVIYEVFHSTYAQINQEENFRLLSAQLNTQGRQLSLQEEHLKQMRILRHDLRHYMGSLSSLLEKGDIGEARDLLKKVAQPFEEPEPRRYCSNAVLNAELSYYIGKAKQAGVKVILHRFDLPDPLLAEDTDLAIVFGNSLENACAACAKLPPEKEKRIELTCSAFPEFLFEIANTYDGKPVRMDESGYPVSDEPGHGIGSRSIAAFVDKYDALSDYILDGGMFRLRILIPAPRDRYD